MTKYCGIGPVPKGKERGTAEYCAASKQIRYYGKKKVDPALLVVKKKGTDIIKEQLKLRALQDKGKILINNIKIEKIIIDNDKSKKSQVRGAEKRLEELLVKRDKLVKNIKKQTKIVDLLEVKKQKKKKNKHKAKEVEKKPKKVIKKKAKKVKGGSLSVNPWIAHVSRYREKHPKLSYKEALQSASKSYRKI